MEMFTLSELAEEARRECDMRRQVWGSGMSAGKARRLRMMERIAELLELSADLEPEESAAAVEQDIFGGE